METTVLPYSTRMNIYSISRAGVPGKPSLPAGATVGVPEGVTFWGTRTFGLHDLSFSQPPFEVVTVDPPPSGRHEDARQ